MIGTEYSFELPSWLPPLTEHWESPFAATQDKMSFVLELVRQNIEHNSGGPFAAAVFDRDTGALISAGVNLVIPSNSSIAHAEMVAIALAQQMVGDYDLGSNHRHFELVTSCEPCAMCFGAIPWSGIRHLVCGAHDSDARAIGFDEGPRHPEWIDQLEQRGITVERDVLRQEAKALLNEYAATGGDIYNGRRDSGK